MPQATYILTVDGDANLLTALKEEGWRGTGLPTELQILCEDSTKVFFINFTSAINLPPVDGSDGTAYGADQAFATFNYTRQDLHEPLDMGLTWLFTREEIELKVIVIGA